MKTIAIAAVTAGGKTTVVLEMIIFDYGSTLQKM